MDQALKEFYDNHFSEAQVCAIRGIVLSTLRSEKCRGSDHPPTIKWGAKTFYPKAEFKAWLATKMRRTSLVDVTAKTVRRAR